MAYRWIISACGQDRPGIVSGVTKVLYDLGCNLEDSAMTLLEGEFTMMLIFSCRQRMAQGELEKAFAAVQRNLDLALHIKALKPAETAAKHPAGVKPYVLSVYGTDQTGIVYRFAQHLAKASINITDVASHRAPSSPRRKTPLYLLLLELELPKTADPKVLQQQLKRLAKRLGVEAELRPVEAEVL
jgi:glycine cleavage system transcriptional repressor